MYDLELLIPVCSKDRYLDKFINFCQNGFINKNNNKILLNFLIGSEDESFFYHNFPKNIHVNYYKSKFNNAGSKVYDFYCNYKNFYRSKWIMKIDDDSKTNIGGLIDFLSKFDYNKDYYFTAERVFGDVNLTFTLLRESRLLDKLKKTYSDLKHEVEVSIFSNSVLKKVLNNYGKIIKRRSKINDGFSDQLFFYLVILSGVKTEILPCISCDNMLQDFLKNKLFHIHFIYKPPKFKRMML